MTDPAFLLDTNIAIYVLEGQYPRLRARLERHPRASIAISVISHGELMRGIDKEDSARLRRADRLFAYFNVLSFDVAASTAYANIPFKRGSFDRLIAAHAISLGLTLVTNNESDFSDIGGLRIENWTI